MGLTNKKEKQLRKMPKIESIIKKSKDGRFVIQQTIITNIKPIEYYEAIMYGKTVDDDIKDLIKLGNELLE